MISTTNSESPCSQSSSHFSFPSRRAVRALMKLHQPFVAFSTYSLGRGEHHHICVGVAAGAGPCRSWRRLPEALLQRLSAGPAPATPWGGCGLRVDASRWQRALRWGGGLCLVWGLGFSFHTTWSVWGWHWMGRGGVSSIIIIIVIASLYLDWIFGRLCKVFILHFSCQTTTLWRCKAFQFQCNE